MRCPWSGQRALYDTIKRACLSVTFDESVLREQQVSGKPAVPGGGLGKAGCVNLLRFWVADGICVRIRLR
jgi:hypothetical protein